MAIKYYPNRIYKKIVPAIDRELAKRSPQTVSGRQNLAVSELNYTLSSNSDWQLDSISLVFSNATARNYGVSIRNGRKVVENLNDYLWFHMIGTFPQRVILNPGFYTGEKLATELKTRMDNNSAYMAAGIVFTVTYDTTTGLFTIIPSSGTIRYLNTNPAQTLRTTDSIAGHLFGLNSDTNFAANIVSDTASFGLNDFADIITETGSTVIEHYHDDLHTLSVDQAVHLRCQLTPGLTITYTVVYEELV